MSELVPQLQPRYAFDLRTESLKNVTFLSESTLFYNVGRHLVLHTPSDQSTLLGMEQMKQNMIFIMRPFIDRGSAPPISTALGGAGANATNLANMQSANHLALNSAILSNNLTSANPSIAPAAVSSATGTILSDLGARQHLAMMNELLEKESFIQDRSTLISCFGILPAAPTSLSAPLAQPDISTTTGHTERFIRKQIALGEYSEQNRMTFISILDLRSLNVGSSIPAHLSATEDESPTQVNAKDIRTHTLFLPWNMFYEHNTTQGRRKGRKNAKREMPGEENEQAESSPNMNLTSVEQTADAASTAAAASASGSVDRASAVSAIPIENTIYSSSAPRIISHGHKDRVSSSHQLYRERQQRKLAAKLKRQEERTELRLAKEAAGIALDSEEDFTGSSSSGEEEDDVVDSSVHPALNYLDAEDDALLTHYQDQRGRKDEDFDYDQQAEQVMKRFAEEKSDNPIAEEQKGSTRIRPSTAQPRTTSPQKVDETRSSRSKPTGLLSRNLTHKLAQTPINQSLNVAYKNGLFQQSTANTLTPSFTKAIVLEFSHDGRYLAIQCDGPRWPLIIWDWQFKQRMMGHPRWVQQPVHTVRWNPNDHSQLCVMGPTVFLQYTLQSSSKLQEASVTSLVTLLNKDEVFTTFTYLPHHANAMVVCKRNKILVLNRGIVIQSLDISNVLYGPTLNMDNHPQAAPLSSSHSHHISNVCPTEKGFAVGTSIHPIGTAYPFEATSTNHAATSPSSLLLLYEFQHNRSLDITPSPDFIARGQSNFSLTSMNVDRTDEDKDRVISTTLFDRNINVQHESNQALQAFRTKCIPLWRTQTGSNKKLPFSLHHLAASPDYTSLALTSSTRELYTLNVSDVDLIDDISSTVETALTAMNPLANTSLTPIITGLHPKAPILSMDISQEQPWILTSSSEDSSIRLWNYLESRCEVVKTFSAEEEEHDGKPGWSGSRTNTDTVQHVTESEQSCFASLLVFSVALHPSRCELLVAFEHHISQFRIVLGNGEFLLRGELDLSHATCLKYSPTGAYFAAVNNKLIYVYATNTLKTVCQFRGHGDIVTSVSWALDESCLTSTGSNGTIYTWNMKTGVRELEKDYINHSMVYSDCVSLPNGNIIAVGIQQSIFGFDLEGLLQPTMNGSISHMDTKKSKSRSNRSKARDNQTQPEDEDEPTHKFVIQWNTRGSAASAAKSNPHLAPGLLYVPYVEDNSEATAAATHSKKNPSSPTNNVLDVLLTLELPVLPYLPPTSTPFHQAALATLKKEQELAEAYGPQRARLQQRPTSAASTGRSSQATTSAEPKPLPPKLAKQLSTMARPQTAVGTRRTGITSGTSFNQGNTTLSSFFLSDEIQKETCPIPPLLCCASLQIGRLTFLLVGTPRGTIQVFLWPPFMLHGTSSMSGDPLTETCLHSAPITAVRVCQKTQCVISTALDGSMFVSSMSLVVNGGMNTINVNTINLSLDEKPEPTTTSSATGAKHSASAFSSTFPIQHFLTPLFYPSLYPLCPSTLRRDIFGEQRQLVDKAEAAEVTRRKAENLKYGARRLESIGTGGVEEEYGLILIKRETFTATTRELASLQQQIERYHEEWIYKLKRDKQELNKTLELETKQHALEKSNLQAVEQELLQRDQERVRRTQEQLDRKQREYDATIQAMEGLYEKKLSLESERFQGSLKKYADLELRMTMDLAAAKKDAEKKQEELKTQFEVELGAMKRKLATYESKYMDIKESSVHMLEESDFSSDVLYQSLKNDATQREVELSKQVAELTESQKLLRTQLQQLTLKIRHSQTQVSELEHTKQAAQLNQKDLTKKIQAQAAQLKTVQDEVVALKKELEVLTKNNTLLQGDKVNLREQIDSLLEDRRANDTTRIKAEFDREIRELDSEAYENLQRTRILDQQLASLKSTVSALQGELALSQTRLEKKETLFARLKEDIIGMKDIRRLREKYFQTFLASDGLKTRDELEAEVAIEKEYTRQTKKNHATISYLEHKVEDATKSLSQHNAASSNENATLMAQINELRHVNRDFKSEIIRLSGELVHARLVLSSHGVINADGTMRIGKNYSPPKTSGTIPQQLHQLKSHAVIMDPTFNTTPSSSQPTQELKQEIRSLEQQLLQERFTNAQLQAEASEAERALKQKNELSNSSVEQFQQLTQHHEQMLRSSFERIGEQEDEISRLKAMLHSATTAKQGEKVKSPKANQAHRTTLSADFSRAQREPETQPNYAYLQPSASTTSVTPLSASTLASSAANANATASYVDSIIQRAAALRSQLSSQASLGVRDTDDLDEDVSGYNSSQPISRPTSASFHIHNSDPHASSQVSFTTSLAVPPRGQRSTRPQTATVRGGGRSIVMTGGTSHRPASAVSKGGRAGKNVAAWNPSSSIVSTRTGSMDSTNAPTSASSSSAPTPAPTSHQIPVRQQFQHGLRANTKPPITGSQTVRVRPSSASVHHSTTATTTTSSLSSDRSMVSGWMDEPSSSSTSNLIDSANSVGTVKDPPLTNRLRPSSAHTANLQQRQLELNK